MMLAFFNPVFADMGQIIGFIVAFFVLVRWVFGQIQDTKKQAARARAQAQQPNQAQRQPRPQQPPRPQAPPQPAAAQAGQQADPLRDQVEAFLRRAAKQQQPNPPRTLQRPPQRAADQIEILVGDEPSGSKRRPLAEPLRSASPPPTSPSQPPARRIGSALPAVGQSPLSSVAQHVDQHVSASTQALSQKTSQLGQRIITEDEQFDVQLKAKFDHSIGRLAASSASVSAPTEGAPARETPAGQLAAMLAQPDGLRQAVILNEVLRRPVDRW